MIDLLQVERYKENNRIEAKRATGGFPGSLWETYSAFANTLGGVILLGVEERKDKSLHPVGLPDPEATVRDFWRQINDPRVTSVNILTDEDLRIETVDGKRILSITVPRAPRYTRPVYIGNDPVSGSYRRNGEGDYRCLPEEVAAMRRDAAQFTEDMRLLEAMGAEHLDSQTIEDFRNDFSHLRSGHAWNSLENAAFLLCIGATAETSKGQICPTAAGLLLFGKRDAVKAEFPQVAFALNTPETEIVGNNIYDFYCRASAYLTNFFSAVKRGNTLALAAKEALSNALVNADYRQGGVSLVLDAEGITLTNAGLFRVDPDTVLEGGISDPRNAALSRLFHLVRAGERVGGGIPKIFADWHTAGYRTPSINERISPDQTIFLLPLEQDTEGCAAPLAPGSALREKALAIDALTDHIRLTPEELAARLSITVARATQLLEELLEGGVAMLAENGRFALRA